MKKHIITLLIVSVFAGVSAQSYTQAFDSVFQHVDLRHTSTGILYERVLPLSNLTSYVTNIPYPVDICDFRQFVMANDEPFRAGAQHTFLSDSVGLYKFAAGVSIGLLGSAYTMKYAVSKKCMFQTDLGIKYFLNLVGDEGGISPVILILVEASQNFLYQHTLATKEKSSFYFLLGGGVSGGLTPYGPITWKVGANPLFGLEIVLKKPKMSFQVDLRPGYAALLRTEKAQQSDQHPFITGFTSGIKQYPYHGYDISLNFAVKFYKIN